MGPSESDEITWMSLPHKDQLFVLVFARFSEPLVRTSIVSYVYYQLRSFDTSLPPEAIVEQAATLQTVFTLFQCATVLLWGRLSDSPKGGRKMVLMVGLAGSMVSSVAFGFVRSFRQALIVRAIEGAVNGNVAVIRTMVSEVVEDQRYKPRAFLLMPMAFNVAVILGPIMAYGAAASTNAYADTPRGSVLSSRYPFALPALLNGVILLVAFLLVTFRLEETLKTLRVAKKTGAPWSRVRDLIGLCLGWRKERYARIAYHGLDAADEAEEMMEWREGSEEERREEEPPAFLPLRRIFTRNLCLTIASQAILEGHVGAYNTLWPSFLSASVPDPDSHGAPRVWAFSGGLGMPIRDVARSLVVIGIVGLPMQILGYPRVARWFGTLRLWRIFLLGFPIAYFVTPFLAVLPSKSPPPAPRDGPLIWLTIVFIQALVVVSGTFVLPAQLTLTNNASPHPSALGRTHSMAVFLSSLARSASPIVGGFAFGYGSQHEAAGAVWWMMSLVAFAGCVLSSLVREGNGHEVKLPGDKHETDG